MGLADFTLTGFRLSTPRVSKHKLVYAAIADVTPTLKDILETNDAYPTPDGQGYYGFQKTFGIYYEVTSYDKLLQDARKRNCIFFDKLNVLSQA